MFSTFANRRALEAALRIAEAEIDLLRVRRVRNALLADPKARAKVPSARDLIHAMKQNDPKEFREDDGVDPRGRTMLRALKGVNELCEPLTLAEGLDALAAPLARLDRYERRALSRRKFAIREFDSLSAR